MNMKRRDFLKLSCGAGALMAAVPALAHAMTDAGAAPIPITVYKSPTCGCCGEWVKYMDKNGFATKVILMDDPTPMRREAGVPDQLGSCHTALLAATWWKGMCRQISSRRCWRRSRKLWA